MDLQNQQRVKDAGEKYGSDCIIILDSSDAEDAKIYAETVKIGRAHV